MNQPLSPPSTGLVAGKYQLVTMIGRGGMGSVWEARHASLGTRFAIKFIEAEYADSQEARKRFDNEAKAAATIQSKHAIQIYDHGVTEDGKPYIVMELLQGQPLDKRIDERKRLTLPETADILQQVCRGLARAHERGIVHRDLKPENIFLVMDPEDGSQIAKVLDFGIAKLSNTPGQPGLTSSTKTGAVLGTPFYMSPEQARGLRNVDHRTDIWSLGVIAYKCVVGKLPFDGESVGDLLVKICTAPIPIPSHAVPGLSPEFDAVFMRALEREPERRYTSVTEFAEGLARAAGIASRGSAASNPNSFAHGATAAVPSGAITPQGLGPPVMLPTPAPMQSPFGTGSQGYGHPQHAQSFGARTPNPAGMTNAPFTSSQPIGVPAGGGKGKLFAIGGVMLVVGGLLAFAAVKQPWKAHAEVTEGAEPTPSASASVAVAAPPPSDTPAPPASTTAPGAGTIAVNAAPPAGATPTPTKTTTTKVTHTTHTTTTHTATTATTASAAPTPTASAKKPPQRSKDDPGY